MMGEAAKAVGRQIVQVSSDRVTPSVGHTLVLQDGHTRKLPAEPHLHT